MKIDPKKIDKQKTVILIDGSSFLYRAYYSIRPLHTPTGVAVQAVYGFCRMVKKLLDTFDPKYIAVVWDSKGKTTRHEMFSEYKATRQAPPSDLFTQKEFIVQFIDAIGMEQVQQQGIEADDIMFSIAQERIQEDETVVLVTSDKDMGQAINDRIVLYDPIKEKIVDAVTFEQEKGFSVKKLPFYFALLGDTSDNIPGVRGVGKTGAQQLVEQFASLSDLYERINEVKSVRMRTALQQYKDMAFLSEQLFLLQYHPSGVSKEDLSFDTRNWSNASVLFKELNFASLLKDMPRPVTEVAESVKTFESYSFKTVTTAEQLQEVCNELRTVKACALDTETTGLNPLSDACVGISLCMQEGVAYYIPFGHHVEEQQLSRHLVVAMLKPLFEDPLIEKYLHNAKFDQLVLSTLGISLVGVAFDTVLAASLLMAQDWQRLGLKHLSMHYFNEPMLSFADVVKAYKLKDFSYVPLELATRYAAADAHQTLKLKNLLHTELDTHEKIKELFKLIEMPTSFILTKMEQTGIFMDVTVLDALNTKVTQRLQQIEEDIALLVGADYTGMNLNSPKQVQELLFVKLALPPQKKSAKGSYSTDQEVLEFLATLHPVPGLIMQYRELSKLKSTYIDALPEYINPTTHKIHTTYNQVGVATGRLSSNDPNLQNIPADATGYGIEVRAAFKPDSDYIFLSADYSQIELRVLAQLSGDVNLTHAFLQQHDIHAETASRLFEVPLEQVSHEQRQVGKRINFSILYGLTPYGLSKDLNIPFKEAKQYIDKYFAQYPGVSAWMEQTIQETKERGYVETFWGRRRAIPSINERNRVLFDEACRVAINTRAQGTAAEIMKLGMIALDKAFVKHALDAYLVLQIHDELLIAVHRDQQERAQKVVEHELEHVVDWNVPLKVTTRFGETWKEVTK